MDLIKLDKQMNRFIKSGFKKSMFTNDLYEMLYIHCNTFIAHNDKNKFHSIRFNQDAQTTMYILETVSKPELFPLCNKLRNAMQKAMKEVIVEIKNSSVL